MSITPLFNVDDALEQILAHFDQLPSETVPLDDAYDRVLAKDVFADTPLPPFANSSMDGFAVIAADTQTVPAAVKLVMDIPAGTVPAHGIQSGEAARIMTGAPLPEGADAVVPVEQTDQVWSPNTGAALSKMITIHKTVKPGDFIRAAGEDAHSGETILKAGTLLRGAEIGILAAAGLSQILVIRRPRAVIISTGDELLRPDEPLSPGKIRDSNSYALSAYTRTYGGIAIRLPSAKDDIDEVRARFQQALSLAPDLIISSAGVSVGAFDIVKAVIEEMGALDFWRVNIRPGKPLAFGHIHHVPYFGLPGNPVSSLVTFDVFVRPVLLKLGGRFDPLPTITARVGENLSSDGRRSYLRVKLIREGGEYIAFLTGTQSSGALTSMVKADGLLIVPEEVTEILQGTMLPVRLLRPI